MKHLLVAIGLCVLSFFNQAIAAPVSKVRAVIWTKNGEPPRNFINGTEYFDPQGTIKAISSWSSDGYLTYFVTQGASLVVKMIGVNVDESVISSSPRPLGAITKTGNTYTFITPSGDGIGGTRLIPISQGVLAIREGIAFLWQPDKPVVQVPIPKDYIVSPVQNGDVLGTRMLALIAKSEPLFNLGGREMVLLHIDKKAIVFKTKTYVTKEADNLDFEKLENLIFFNTSKHTFAVAFNNGSSELNATDVDSNLTRTLFKRDMGINWMKVDPMKNNVFQVKYWVPWSPHTIADIDVAFEATDSPAEGADTTAKQ